MTPEELLQKLIDVDGITPGLGEADRVLCMSEVLQEACLRVGVPPEKITVLGNRVSTTRFRPQPQPNYDPNVVRALLVGRLEEQKNIHAVARALAILKSEGWRVRLDVCGGPAMNDYLRRALDALEPSDWHYWGAVANRDLPARYCAVDMYVGPSLFEGFQIPLIEALACGKPCVAGDQPPASEIIDPRVGALVDPTDPSAIAAGIRQLKQRLNDPDRRAEISETCRKLATDKWSYQVISNREAKVYLETLASFGTKCGCRPSRCLP